MLNKTEIQATIRAINQNHFKVFAHSLRS
jgi:hypothetical protein